MLRLPGSLRRYCVIFREGKRIAVSTQDEWTTLFFIAIKKKIENRNIHHCINKLQMKPHSHRQKTVIRETRIFALLLPISAVFIRCASLDPPHRHVGGGTGCSPIRKRNNNWYYCNISIRISTRPPFQKTAFQGKKRAHPGYATNKNPSLFELQILLIWFSFCTFLLYCLLFQSLSPLLCFSRLYFFIELYQPIHDFPFRCSLPT